MQKEINKKVSFCDACGKEQDYLEKCLSCGVEHCYDCRKELGKEYTHGVYFQGSGDGYYCHKCDAELSTNRRDVLHNAYVAIVDLRSEEHRWYDDFKKRVDAAENKVKELAR